MANINWKAFAQICKDHYEAQPEEVNEAMRQAFDGPPPSSLRLREFVNESNANARLNKAHYETATMRICQSAHLDDMACLKVQYMIKIGADINRRNALGQTPMHFAAGSGHFSLVKVLVDAKAKLDIQDKLGKTPLMAAVEHNEVARNADDVYKIVNYILRANANPKLTDIFNQTALDMVDDNYVNVRPLLREAMKRK